MKERAVWLCTNFIAVALLSVCAYAAGPKAQTLHSFTGGTDGGYPYGPVVQDKAGNLYGSTGFGGDLTSLCAEVNNTPGCGVVFKIDTTGQFTVLHSFDGFDGQWVGGVILDAEDNLYGTADDGDIPTGGEYGTVFKIEP